MLQVATKRIVITFLPAIIVIIKTEEYIIKIVNQVIGFTVLGQEES